MRDQSVNGIMTFNQLNTCPSTQLTNTEGSPILSITSPVHSMQQQQQHSPDFNVNGIRPRTSSNASSLNGYDVDTLPFRDRSTSNASSCGGAITGITGHLSPPSLNDYPDQDTVQTGVCIWEFLRA